MYNFTIKKVHELNIKGKHAYLYSLTFLIYNYLEFNPWLTCYASVLGWSRFETAFALAHLLTSAEGKGDVAVTVILAFLTQSAACKILNRN